MLQTTIMRFSELLEIRLKNGVFTTEDAVRYTFFSALMETTDLQPHHVIPEQPHPAMLGKKIDTYITGADICDIAMEFKYDRSSETESNSPTTQKSSALFCDFQRLLMIPSSPCVQRIMVYLTDQEMASYLDGNVSELWHLAVEEKLILNASFFNNRTKTFMNELVNRKSFEGSVTLSFSKTLPTTHELRVYSINSEGNK